ncbi:MAG: spore coat protein CotJB [Lachnospiraceae bacterium]|nr:spore coat protein CotJB [Lachnospiraceae bacterium]
MNGNMMNNGCGNNGRMQSGGFFCGNNRNMQGNNGCGNNRDARTNNGNAGNRGSQMNNGACSGGRGNSSSGKSSSNNGCGCGNNGGSQNNGSGNSNGCGCGNNWGSQNNNGCGCGSNGGSQNNGSGCGNHQGSQNNNGCGNTSSCDSSMLQLSQQLMNMSEQQLLLWLSQVSFAMYDATLYLDTHPTDNCALEYFQTMRNKRKAAMDIYARKFGPLLLDNSGDGCNWDWGAMPLPWE